MDITDYCDIINTIIDVHYIPNQEKRWMAKFEDCEVMVRGMLAVYHGNGHTPDEAILDYIEQIKGKRIAFNAYRDNRVEYDVPENLSYK